LVTHLLFSARTLGLGFGIAAMAGLCAGTAMATFPRLGRALGPLVIIGYATPLVALLPLLILALGIGEATKIAIAALLGVFPVAITAEAGLRSVDRDYLDTAHAFGAGAGKRLASVVLPAAAVPVIAGLRLGLGRALIGTVVAEIYLADAGLGYLIAFSTNTLEVGKVLAVVLLLVALGVGLNAALEAAERRLSPWRWAGRSGRWRLPRRYSTWRA
jgi:NitT/TauT family transport system permease protein